MTNFVLKLAVNRCLSNFNYQDNGVSLISKKIFIAPSAIYIFVETATKTTKQHVKTNKQNLTDNMQLIICLFFFCFFSIQDFSQEHSQITRLTSRRVRFFNSSLPLQPASTTLRHLPDNYCRELTTANCQHMDSNKEPLVSERKSLTGNT